MPTVEGVPFGLHPAQQDFTVADELICGFVSGRGAGKSFVGAYKTIRRARRGRFYMVLSPTRVLSLKTTWKDYNSLLLKFGRRLNVNKSEMTIDFRTDDGGVAQVGFFSADEPERLRGPNASGLHLDEGSIMQEDAFRIASSCLREGGEMGQTNLTFTPKGRGHWTYKIFYDEDGRPVTGRKLVRASTAENPFNHPDFYVHQKSLYTSYLAQQELEGLFIDAEGLMLRREWLEIVPAAPKHGMRIRYWDKAGTKDGGDYSAGVLMLLSDGVFYIEDVIRGQWGPFERNKIMRQTAECDQGKYRGAVRVFVEQEPGSGGKESALITIQELAGFNIFIDKVTGKMHQIKDAMRLPGEGKIARAQPFAAQAEARNVKIVRGVWNSAYLDELCMFPEATHDDQVDATSGAFNHLAPNRPMEYDRPAGGNVERVTPSGMGYDRRTHRQTLYGS